jgi:hypothetical protein
LRWEIDRKLFADVGSSDMQATNLEGFFRFPSLSRLFQGEDRTALANMRSKLAQTNQDLDRIVRQGSKADADRATVISRSYSLTLTILEEIDRHVT